MAWFGWRYGRDGARPALGRGTGVARPVGEWPQGYEAQVRAGYCGNAVAQRAVRLVAESVDGAPLDVSDARLRALVSGRGLLETVAAQLLLHGNGFVQILRDADGGVAELYPLRPERVSVELGADGWPAAYVYRVGVRSERLDTGAVIHVRRFNPLDDHYGLGCLAAASGAIAIHNAAGSWSKALLDNAARPSGALVYDAGDGSVLSPEQFRRLREEMEAGFAGAANAGRPMLLEGGLKWQAMSLTPADLDFAGTKAAAAREIALGFGVPPMLLGLPGDSTHANYKEANKALWRLTVLPLAGAILTALRDGLAEWFAGATLAVDLDRVPALVEDRERLWRMVRARRGTAPSTHAPGTAFALLEQGSIRLLPLAGARPGDAVRLLASSVGDVTPVAVELVLDGMSVAPPSPVHLRHRLHADGGVTFEWVRRSRFGWRWDDGAEVPTGEEGEAYLVTVTSSAGTRSMTSSVPSLTLSAAGRGDGPLRIVVRQQGSQAPSRPVELTI